MKTNRQVFALRVSVAAVHAALLALVVSQAAYADDQEPSVKELTRPTNTVEVGAEWVSRDSFKFGEYNGLGTKGGYGIGNLDLRGGGLYDSTDTSRWRFIARDLGTEARSLKGEYGWQGRFRINLGYDELLRNDNDRYQTPYLGAGTTSLVLPGNWRPPVYPNGTTMGAGNTFPTPAATMVGLAATGYNSPLVTNTAYICRATTNGCAINPALGGTLGSIYTVGLPTTAANTAMLAQNLTDLNDFHFVDLSTKRQKFDAGASYEFDPNTNLAFSYRQETKKGLREMGVVNADGGPAGSFAGENSVIFPKLIDTVTDQYNASYNYTDKKKFVTLAYYGSYFTNNIKSMTIANPWQLGPTAAQNAYGVSSAAISEEPDNSLNQFKLTAGYNLLPRTKVVVDGSWSRNAQNDPFVLDPAMYGTPTGAAGAAVNNASYSGEASANAKIVNKTFDLKLTSRPLDRVTASAGFKYDNRDNQTPVNLFVWYDAGAKNFGAPNSVLNGSTPGGLTAPLPTPGNAAAPLYSGVNIVANRPYSKTVNQVDGDVELALAPGHALKLGVERQEIDRYCNGTWIDCSFADSSDENIVKAEYRFTAAETVSGRIAFDESSRTVQYNPNAWMSLVPSLGGLSNIPSLAAAGWSGSVLGFMNSVGIGANGLPIAANASSGLTGSNLAVYNLLFGNGNGSLNQNYYANHNVTNNWAGLDVFNMANRDRSRVRGSLNWQTTDTLGLQGGFDWRRDNYPANAFGLIGVDAWSLNLDAAFTPSEDFSLDGYYTHEDQMTKTGNDPAGNGTVSRNAATGTAYAVTGGGTGTNSNVAGLCAADRSAAGTAGLPANATPFQIYNNNAKIDPCAQWTANMRDMTDTIGLAFTKRHLVSRKFSLSGDASYSRSVTKNSMNGGFYAANTTAGFAANVPAVFFINAASLPDVTTSIAHFGLSGRYQLNKSGAVRLAYSFNWLHTSDYMYQTTTAAGTSSSLLPTLDTAQNYVVHVIGVSYSYSFQ